MRLRDNSKNVDRLTLLIFCSLYKKNGTNGMLHPDKNIIINIDIKRIVTPNLFLN